MVELDAAVLTRARLRVESFVVLGAAVGAWFVAAPHVGPIGLWPSAIVVSFGVLPATLGLVYAVLPLAERRWQALLLATAGLAVVAFGCSEAGWDLAANFAKLWAAVFTGWAFLRLFEELWWVVLVAALIPVVDAISVFSPNGPTHEITAHHISVYNDVAVAFFAPGHRAIQLGPPDILFYALFLAAASRWRLRVGWTWVAITGMYAIVTPLAIAADVNGLPALPFLSFGFLVANADLLWHRLRKPRQGAQADA